MELSYGHQTGGHDTFSNGLPRPLDEVTSTKVLECGMEMLFRGMFVVFLFGVIVAHAANGSGDQNAALRLTLPPVFYAVPGVEMSIYYDNIVLTETPENCQFKFTCDIGSSEPRRWTVTPTAKDVGFHALTVEVAEGDKVIAKAKTKLRVVPAEAGTGKEIRVLIVGDSLTHATVYPNEVARLLSLPGNPKWEMIGTFRPAGAAPGVGHEGYGGWTWVRFANHYEPAPDGTYKKMSSPFVFMGEDGKPVLDVARYFDEKCGGKRPDYVTFLLGINDCFGLKPDDPAAIDKGIDAMFTQAETLLAAFRKAAPQSDLSVCITTPPNSREEGFYANYQGNYHRWGWKRIQHRLVERELAQFGGREKDHIFSVPTELNVDPVDGYPNNNGVHPNAVGYQQIGASIYAWIKARLSPAK